MYDPILAEIHDRWFDQIAVAAAAHVAKRVGDAPGLSVMDLGCGGGTLLTALAARFVTLRGIDLSADMVERARGRVPQAALSVGDVLGAEWPPSAVATMVGEILSYAMASVPDDEVAGILSGFFRRVHRGVVPGGLFLFDVLGDRHDYTGHFFHDEPDWTVHSEVSQSGALVHRHIVSFLRRGQAFGKSVEDHRLRTFDAGALEGALRDSGFAVERLATYGSLPMLPGRIAFECRRLE